MKAPPAATSTMNARCASRRRRGRALAAVKDQRNDGQHGAVRKCRFHATIVAQCLQQSRARERDSLRPFAGRLHGMPQGLVDGASHRRAARQIRKHHAIATAAAIDQNAVSRRVAHASHASLSQLRGQRRVGAGDHRHPLHARSLSPIAAVDFYPPPVALKRDARQDVARQLPRRSPGWRADIERDVCCHPPTNSTGLQRQPGASPPRALPGS